jgi:hypothetical protein
MPTETARILVDLSTTTLEKIAASLPAPQPPSRRNLLANVLEDWGAHELRRHLAREPRRVILGRITRQVSIANRARQLLLALGALDDTDVGQLAYQMKQVGQNVDRTEITKMNDWLDRAPEFLQRLAEISPSQFWQLRPGQPPNLVAYLVLLDAADIFQWYAGKKPTRSVDRISGTETGPFFRFASVLWPVVFGAEAMGLSTAIRNWAHAKKKYKERSALMANVDLRHPEWRIFDA